MFLDMKYRAVATATGGRDGGARTSDGNLDVRLVTPKELGGLGGEGTNPEQLFAAGYSGCFLSSMKVAAPKLGLKVPADASVTAAVGIGPRAAGGFGIAVDLAIDLPGVDRRDATRLVDTAHQSCPYSNATRNNIDVTLSVIS